MGNAAFFYRPIGAQQMVGINLQGPANGREGPFTRYDLASSTSMSGIRYVRIYSGVERLTVKKTIQRAGGARTADKDKVIRKLRGMIAHLKRGGTVTYTEDTANMVAAFATNIPFDNAGYVNVGPRITIDLAGTVSFAGLEVVIRSDPDRLLLEERLCESFSSGTVDIDANLGEDFSGSRWILVRQSGTYPAMRLPEDALGRDDFLTSGEDFTYDLNLPLEDDVNELERLARDEGQIGSELPSASGAGLPPSGGNVFDQLSPPYRW